MPEITVGYLQYEVAFGEWQHNAETVRRLLDSIEHINLLVLPELAFSGYDFLDRAEAMRYAEDPQDGATAHFLRGLAYEKNAYIVAGYPERGADAPYNAAMLITPQGDVHNYRKIHLFNREQEIFLPGDAPAPVIETPLGNIGVMICFDWFFPECTRSLALRGADIIVHPSNLVLPWCQRAMFARSLENHVFTITANRTGAEARSGRPLSFSGASQILNPRGECLAAAPSEGEHIGLACVDLFSARDKRIAGLNDLVRDRRPDMYPGLS